MRKIEFIVLHCTAGPQNQSLEAIRSFWRSQGWKRPGYHRLIAADGTVHELADISQITNGVAGHNSTSIHISYIGGVQGQRPIDNRTAAQREKMLQLVQQFATQFPNAVILGHRDFSPDKNRDGIIQPNEWIKACPSFSVKSWLDEVGFKAPIAPQSMRTTTRVNIRSGSGANFPPLSAPLEANTAVKRIGEGNGWTYVQVPANSLKGWIRSDFLQTI